MQQHGGYNKICRNSQLKPEYINIEINDNNKRSTNTKAATVSYRLNQEIRFLCIKIKNTTQYTKIKEYQEVGPLKICTPLRTQTQLDTVNTYVYIANIHNK
jgi:hypothetical protein